MARIVVRVVDKTSQDQNINRRLSKRGDVIEIFPDGWVFSERERTNPHWMIVDIPGVAPESFSSLRNRVPGDGNRGTSFNKRDSFYNFSRLPGNIRNRFDGTRVQESITINKVDLDTIIENRL